MLRSVFLSGKKNRVWPKKLHFVGNKAKGLISNIFVKIAIFCRNIFYKNIAKWFGLWKVIIKSNSHEHDYSIHCTIFCCLFA